MKLRRIKGKGWLLTFAILAAIVLFAHPYFAVTRPSGGKVLVAEGWMHHVGLQEAADLFHRGGYEHLYVTGTLRPFAYYLGQGDAIDLTFPAPMQAIELAVGGLPGAYWTVTSATDTLLRAAATPKSERHVIDPAGRALRTLRIQVDATTAPGTDQPVGFIGALLVNGANPHATGALVTIQHADGTTSPGEPTYAEEARAELVANGVPGTLLTVVPTIDVGDGGRTVSSARSFVAYAQQHGIGAFDVATLGVHARRTWKSYRVAKGGREGVGIIALYDPWCRRWGWWRNIYGWYQMTKEFAALPQTWWNDLR